MVQVLFFLGPASERGAAFVPLERPVELARVPTAGELVSLGKDDDGLAADYRVMLVRFHVVRSPSDVAADVYARRVSAAVEVSERAPRHQAGAPWKASARPKLPSK